MPDVKNLRYRPIEMAMVVKSEGSLHRRRVKDQRLALGHFGNASLSVTLVIHAKAVQGRCDIVWGGGLVLSQPKPGYVPGHHISACL